MSGRYPRYPVRMPDNLRDQVEKRSFITSGGSIATEAFKLLCQGMELTKGEYDVEAPEGVLVHLLEPVSVHMPADTKAELERRARISKRSMNSQVVEMIERAINDNVDRDLGVLQSLKG